MTNTYPEFKDWLDLDREWTDDDLHRVFARLRAAVNDQDAPTDIYKVINLYRGDPEARAMIDNIIIALT